MIGVPYRLLNRSSVSCDDVSPTVISLPISIVESAAYSACVGSWVVKMTDIPDTARFEIIPNVFVWFFMSSADVGSSKMIVWGSHTSA